MNSHERRLTSPSRTYQRCSRLVAVVSAGAHWTPARDEPPSQSTDDRLTLVSGSACERADVVAVTTAGRPTQECRRRERVLLLPRESEIALLSMSRDVPVGVVGVFAAFNAPGWDANMRHQGPCVGRAVWPMTRPRRGADRPRGRRHGLGEARGRPALRDQLPRGALGASVPLVACTAWEAGKRWASKQTTVSTP